MLFVPSPEVFWKSIFSLLIFGLILRIIALV